jgi:hypothetical protein
MLNKKKFYNIGPRTSQKSKLEKNTLAYFADGYMVKKNVCNKLNETEPSDVV